MPIYRPVSSGSYTFANFNGNSMLRISSQCMKRLLTDLLLFFLKQLSRLTLHSIYLCSPCGPFVPAAQLSLRPICPCCPCNPFLPALQCTCGPFVPALPATPVAQSSQISHPTAAATIFILLV